MSQAGNHLRRNSTPLELLQDWSAQLQQNEARLQRKVKSTMRRQASRNQGRNKAVSPGGSSPVPAGSSPYCQPAQDGENVVRQGSPVKSGMGPATSPPRSVKSPQHLSPGDGGSSSPNISPSKVSSSSKKAFGLPLRYSGQTPVLPRSSLEAPPLQQAGSTKRGLFACGSDEEDVPAFQHRLPTSPARVPGMQTPGHAAMLSPVASPSRPLHRSPIRQVSPAPGQHPATAGEKGAPPASPSQLHRHSAMPSPSRVTSPTSSQQYLPGSEPQRQRSTWDSPGQTQQQRHTSPTHRLVSPTRRGTLVGQWQEQGLPLASPTRRRQSPAASPSGLAAAAPPSVQRQARSPAAAMGAAPPGSAHAWHQARAPPTSNSPGKLALEASPMQQARQLSPARGGRDFRIRAVSGAKSERSRVRFCEGLVMEEEEAEGSEEEAFFSAAPSRTTSLAVTAHASARNSPHGSPSASSNTVLQRLERTADTLAAVAVAEAASCEPRPAADDYDDLDALLLGKMADGSPAKPNQEHRTPDSGSPVAMEGEEGQHVHSMGRRSPANLFGLFGRGGSPAKAETPSQGASSPLRQRLLSGPATFLSAATAALGWGGKAAPQETSEHGDEGAGAGAEQATGSQQPSLPSNPFDMLSAEDSGGAGDASSKPEGGDGHARQHCCSPLAAPGMAAGEVPAPTAGGASPWGSPTCWGVTNADLEAPVRRQLSPAARSRRQPQQHRAPETDALRASVASSAGDPHAANTSWDGGASVSTPTRLVDSRDNPLFEPFASSIVPTMTSPEGTKQRGLPATQFLGGMQLPAGDSMVLQGSMVAQGAAAAQLAPGEVPGSAGSFAAGWHSPLEPVLEQEDEGMSSPDMESRRHAAAKNPAKESVRFSHLEEQAEAWAQVHKPGWSTLPFQLPPAMTAEEEASLTAPLESPACLEAIQQQQHGLGREIEEACGADGLEATNSDSQTLLTARDASSNSTLWQLGLDGRSKAEADTANSSGAAAGASLGPLEEAWVMHSQQQQGQPDWAMGGTAGIFGGGPDTLRSTPFDARLAAAGNRGSMGMGELLQSGEDDGEKGNDDVEGAYTMPLRFSLLRRHRSAGPQQQQQQSGSGSFGSWDQPQDTAGRFGQHAAPHSGQGRSPGGAQAFWGGHQQLSSAEATSIAAASLAESSMDLQMGRSISLKMQPSTQPGALASTQTSTPIHWNGSRQNAGTAPPAAAAAAQPPLAAFSGMSSPARRRGSAPAAEGSPGRRPFGVRQHQKELNQLSAARHQQQAQQADAPPSPAGHLPTSAQITPKTSPVAAFRRGLSPLQVQFDQDNRAPASATRPQGGPAAASLDQAARFMSPSTRGAGLGQPGPSYSPGPASARAAASPDLGRSGAKTPGKRYSPESLQYKERLKRQGEVISSLHLRRQLSGLQEHQQQRLEPGIQAQSQRASAQPTPDHSPLRVPAGTGMPTDSPQKQPWGSMAGTRGLHASSLQLQDQAGGLRDSASFHTAHATPPRQQGQQHSLPFRLSPSPAFALAAAATAPDSHSPAASPSPLSKLRPAATAGQHRSSPAGSLRYSTPKSELLSVDASVAQQGGVQAPAETPQMTPLTAINKLRANLQHGSAWEGQQQQMQSILSRLESRVRETRVKAKTEAEKRTHLEKQVCHLEEQVKSLTEEADQASTLKWELTAAQVELEQLRDENLKLQREREEGEAQLARERERLKMQLAAVAAMRTTRGRAMANAPAHPYPAAAATDPEPAAVVAPAAAGVCTARGLDGMAQLQEPPQQGGEEEDLRFVPPSPPAPAGYTKPGVFVQASGPRLPVPSAPRANSAMLRPNGMEPAVPRQPLNRGDSAFAPQPRSQAKHTVAPLELPSAPPPITCPRPLAGEEEEASTAYPDIFGVPMQPDAAARGRLSNGSNYSDPRTEPWHSMQPAQVQRHWQQQQPYAAGREQPATWSGHEGRQECGPSDPPLSARYPGQSSQQEWPPRGSTWDPCTTPHGKDLQRLLRVAGDSSMFRPLYTGACDIARDVQYSTL